ncbi:MAG: hypothetical protein EOP48_34960, partial [Sphingobacteriales bacterium]
MMIKTFMKIFEVMLEQQTDLLHSRGDCRTVYKAVISVGSSPQSQTKDKEKPVHKSVIQEKANIAPPKDWDEPTVPTEIKDLTTSDMPINEESVVKYESQFPSLGESGSETLAKSEMIEFTPEILNPQTIVQTS